MREHTRRCTVGVPAGILWDYLSDYRNVIQLGVSECDAVLETGAPGVAGAKYSGLIVWEGLESRFSAVLEDAARPERRTWTGVEDGAMSSLRVELEPCGPDATLVHATLFFSLSDSTRPLEPFGWALESRMLERMMRKMRGLSMDELSS